MIRALFQKPCQCTIPDTTNQKFALFQKPCQCLYDKSNVIYFLLIMIRDSGKKKCDISFKSIHILLFDKNINKRETKA